MSETKRSHMNALSSLPFMLFALTLVFLTINFPIKVPITDDWLYLSQGARAFEEKPGTYLELITGHQQVLVKLLVLCVSYLPGNYVQNLTLVNIFLASIGLFLLFFSQFRGNEKRFGKCAILIAIVDLCNLKSMYIYMSATGVGLTLAILLIGIYYLGKNSESLRNSRTLVLTSLFLSPFTTGLGLVIPMSHLLSVALTIAKEKNIRKYSLDILISTSGMAIAYLLPTLLRNLNSRSGDNSVSDLDSYLSLLMNPIKSTIFLFGLIGNPIFPSSRFDPVPQISIGIIVTVIFACFLIKNRPRQLFFTLAQNQNPLLSGIMFLALIISFRGEKSIEESTAPRYVIGSVLFLFGAYVYILKSKSASNSKILHKLAFAFAFIMLLSLSGIKTGTEWLILRSNQSEALYTCIRNKELAVEKCVNIGSELREEGTSDVDFLADLRKLRLYIEKI